ncbi:hypothetical protein AB5I41_09215 [Sphingomonas sp. MMS24-JH45]
MPLRVAVFAPSVSLARWTEALPSSAVSIASVELSTTPGTRVSVRSIASIWSANSSCAL